MSAAPIEREDFTAKWKTISGATFLLFDAPRPEECNVHSHEKLRLSFLLRGSIVEVEERGPKIKCGPFSLHTTPAGMRHAHLIQSDRLTTLCFDLDADLLASMGETAQIFDQPITAKRGSVMAMAPRFQREVLARDSASDLVLQGLILELAGELSRRKLAPLPPSAPNWLRRASEMLNDTWNQHVAIEHIAAAVGIHPSHLNRVFKAYLAQTPGEYVRRIRMERATRAVLATDLPLKAIAATAGFADQAHFTREFRRAHGTTPIAMRRSVRGTIERS